jgi:hypothetical protein
MMTDISSSTLGTAAAAKFFVAVTILSNPTTVSPIADALEQRVHVAQTTTQLPSFIDQAPLTERPKTQSTLSIASRNVVVVDARQRPTTLREKHVGELRRWALLKANWDNEGAATPDIASLREAVAFTRLLDENAQLLEPMLLASGHAALYLNNSELYADLEFLGDGRVAYFIEHPGEGRHKGVTKFDQDKMPVVFAALLRNQVAV